MAFSTGLVCSKASCSTSAHRSREKSFPASFSSSMSARQSRSSFSSTSGRWPYLSSILATISSRGVVSQREMTS